MAPDDTRRPRKRADQALLIALASGQSYADAAQTAGLSVSSVKRRMGDPVFAERLRKLESEQVRCAAVALNNSASDAIATMHALLDDSTPPSVRLGAARALLEFGRLYREAEALELRLLAVEDRLRGLAQP